MRAAGRLGAAIVALAATVTLAGPAVARAGIANAGLPGASARNPLAGMRWGVYTGAPDNVYPTYLQAQGRDRLLMAKIATRPLMFWFGDWFSADQGRQEVQQYIAKSTDGDPSVLSQVAVFRLDPWEQQACGGRWSTADQAGYRSWTSSFAAGIASSRVALVLQPDLPIALCTRSPIPLALVSYAARVFSALPHTTVYLDAGAADWPSVSQAVTLLRRAGVGSARGFALNATHYDATGREVRFGARVAQALARAGLPGKHFVIDTSQNGRPFTYSAYARRYPDPDNPRVCTTAHEQLCVTLGIPPTTQVASPRWGLSRPVRALAARYADAYLWFGRPWLDNQAWPFDRPRALALAASTPF